MGTVTLRYGTSSHWVPHDHLAGTNLHSSSYLPKLILLRLLLRHLYEDLTGTQASTEDKLGVERVISWLGLDGISATGVIAMGALAAWLAEEQCHGQVQARWPIC